MSTAIIVYPVGHLQMKLLHYKEDIVFSSSKLRLSNSYRNGGNTLHTKLTTSTVAGMLYKLLRSKSSMMQNATGTHDNSLCH